jgi:polyphosphate glucokinase
MLFLGLGTGLGSALIVNGGVEPLELAHFPYRKGRSFEDYVGQRGLDRLGRKKWRQAVKDVEAPVRSRGGRRRLLGGGNVKQVNRLPNGVRRCKNANAFRGGMMLWSQRRATPILPRQARPGTAPGGLDGRKPPGRARVTKCRTAIPCRT